MTAKPNFQAMAQAPSYRAPRAKDVLRPRAFVPPQPRMAGEELALMQYVIATPEAASPRLRLADWYEANGNAKRAAFIRGQLTGRDVSPDPAWAMTFEPWCARDLEYRRGFVESMSLAGRSFLALG